MNWSLIAMPAPEELVMGYAPAPPSKPALPQPGSSAEDQEERRYLVSLFVAFGLLAGLQGALAGDPPEGQRRIAEVSVSERKSECRGCGDPIAHAAQADF